MAFEKRYDSLLASTLSLAKTLLKNTTTAIGSVLYFISAAISSIAFGIYKNISWASRQIFPDTCDPSNLDHHGYCAGVDRSSGETDADYLAEILAKRRAPAAGGNAADYVTWAESVDGVAGAVCISTPNGAGSVLVIIWTAETDPTPSDTLIGAVTTYINSKRPIGFDDFQVSAPTLLSTAISMTVSGSGDSAALSTAITAYLAGLEPGDTMYINHLKYLAENSGYSDVSSITPTANVTSTTQQLIRAGTVTVTEA